MTLNPSTTFLNLFIQYISDDSEADLCGLWFKRSSSRHVYVLQLCHLCHRCRTTRCRDLARCRACFSGESALMKVLVRCTAQFETCGHGKSSDSRLFILHPLLVLILHLVPPAVVRPLSNTLFPPCLVLK